MKKIIKLTPEQEAMLPIWRNKWIEVGLSTGETDWDTFDRYMPICYKKAKTLYPKNIVRVSSPLVGGLAASISEEIWRSIKNNNRKVAGAVRDAVEGAVGGAVGGAVRDAVEGAVGGAVRGAVRDAVRGAVGDAVEGAV